MSSSFLNLQLGLFPLRKNNNTQLPNLLRRTLSGTLLELLHIAILVSMLVYTYLQWKVAPDVVSSHFDVNGEVNGHSGKIVLWVNAALAVLGTLVLDITSYHPKQYNLPFALHTERQCYMLSHLMHIIPLFLQSILFIVIYLLSHEGRHADVLVPSCFVLLGVFVLVFVLYLIQVKKAAKYKEQ